MSQEAAAKELGVSLMKVGYLISHEHLEPATTASKVWGTPTVPIPGVTRTSVDSELAWRDNSSRRQRAWRITKDMLRWV